MAQTNKHTFVYIDGRDSEAVSPFMADDFKRASFARGLSFGLLKNISRKDLFDDEAMERIFDEGSISILRNMPKNTITNIIEVGKWLDGHDRVELNFNAVGGINASNDKQFQQFIFKNDERTRDDVLLSYEVVSKDETIELVKAGKVKYPFVLKPAYGSLGYGIVLIEKEADLNNVQNYQGMIAQNFIDSDYDWRVYVIGGVPVGAVRRGGKTEIQHDFHTYANGMKKDKEEDPEVLKELYRISANMAAVAGLEYTGCDIIRDKKTSKYYILEVNTAATWEGHYNEIIKVDLADLIVEWGLDRLAVKEEGFYAGVKAYAEKRIKYLYSDNRGRFEKIMNWSEETERVSGNDLGACLQNCYYDIFHGGDIKDAKALIDEVERRPLSWAGNFLGSPIHGEDGVFEDACIPTGYYLAIREKYDKMVGVN